MAVADYMQWIYSLMIDQYKDGWYICYPDCSKFSGPYKTAAAAKSELTKTKRFYERL